MTSWSALREHAVNAARGSISELLETENRVEAFSISADGLLFDFSKTSLDESGAKLLLDIYDTSQVSARRDAMFAGEKINETEGRAVLHSALRNLDGGPVMVDGVDVMPGVRETLQRMERFAEAVRAGTLRAAGGAITDVVNIGIGGSDLGPVMATRALAPFADGPRVHFVSNVDGADISEALGPLDPTRTLVIVASKTFTTAETMINAAQAKAWMLAGGGDPARQFAAVSTAEELTAKFGIDPDHVFGFEDWVGGRYSIWGPVGLCVMLAVGAESFRSFLRGGAAMDQHFRTAPPRQNMPVMLALVGIWHHQGCGYGSRAVLPYEQRLGRLPAYLQQLEMESNGKGVAMDGRDLTLTAGPVVWGEPGTNGQHAFFQLIHQGRQIVPCEFLVGAKGHEPELADQHQMLVANCLAQSKALMAGRSLEHARALMVAKGLTGEELERQARHRVFTGNRPSTTLLYPKLTPFVLGQIIALYEHRVFVEGVMLGINSFDQWGVELGKELARELGPIVAGQEPAEGKDASTMALIAYLQEQT
ncbi:MAG: glucose-6-phosphate isomerase [Brevirhabdus sp.]